MDSQQISNFKLSSIWDYASKNLRQVRGSTGRVSCNEACAVGAIAFVISNGRTTKRFALKLDERKQYDRIKREFRERSSGLAHYIPIEILNDWFGWSFKKFSNRAKDLGL